ncbi:TPA: hypothetical protein I7158_21095 [Vibrio vulnificus]|nr:hypothetical protein [Vibrio vulnificus]HAU8262129.1 hypothetical protein [Vibrio vulnificus]
MNLKEKLEALQAQQEEYISEDSQQMLKEIKALNDLYESALPKMSSASSEEQDCSKEENFQNSFGKANQYRNSLSYNML